MSITKHICLSCNEDGYGPSAFGYYIARAIVEEWRSSIERAALNFNLSISVFNKSAYNFNCSIYSGFLEVHPIPIDSKIKLEKPLGEVSVPKTLEKLKEYKIFSKAYCEELTPYLDKCDIAIDIGVPNFVRCAKDAGVPHRITVFDHSWAKTLRLISSKEWEYLYTYNPKPTDADHQLAEEIAQQIEEDEKCATEVYLFDRYLTPPIFREHWENLGFIPDILHGVLGRRNEPNNARAILNSVFESLGQKPVSDIDKLILFTYGGTPIWDKLLPEIIDGFIDGPQKEYIPVLSNPNVSDEYKEKMRKSGKIRWLEFIKGSTQQIILPAFDLIITRAGGGTVNDALASKTPFICIEEHQAQVLLIEQECIALHLTPELPETRMSIFEKNPIECIDKFYNTQRIIPPDEIKGNVEKIIAKEILMILKSK